MKHMDWKMMGRRIGGVAGACVLLTALLCGAMGMMISNEWLMIDIGKKAVAGIVLVILYAGSWAAAKKAPCKRLLVSALTAGAILLVLLFAKAILFQRADITSLWHICAAVLVSLPAGLLASRKDRRKR